MSDTAAIQVAMLLADRDFRDEEYAVPRKIFEDAGFQVTTVCEHTGTCVGRFGLTTEAEMTLAAALDESWDVVVFVGGGGAQMYFADEDAYELAKKPVREGAVLGAICIAPTILAHAGLLGGIKATAFPSEQQELVLNGAKWTGRSVEEVSIRGTGATIVTASGPQAASQFALTIRDAVGNRKV